MSKTSFTAKLEVQNLLTRVYLDCVEQEWTAKRFHEEMGKAERTFWVRWPGCDIEKAEVRGFADGLKAAVWHNHVQRNNDGLYLWPSGEFWQRATIE